MRLCSFTFKKIFRCSLITIYNTVTLVRSVIKFLGRNVFFILKIQAFLARDKI